MPGVTVEDTCKYRIQVVTEFKNLRFPLHWRCRSGPLVHELSPGSALFYHIISQPDSVCLELGE